MKPVKKFFDEWFMRLCLNPDSSCHDIENDDENDNENFFFLAYPGSDYMDSVTPDEIMETDGPASEGNDISLPSEADFLYAYSTVPGYYSWRNSQRGSW